MPSPSLVIRHLGLGLLSLLLFQTAVVGAATSGGAPSEPTTKAVTAPTSIIFDHVTGADGLSEGTVIATAQDELGFMWFATQNGLDKYDGYRFTVYTHNPNQPNSLSANNIRSLYLEPQGALWIGTWGGGLNRLDRQTDTFNVYRHDPQNAQSLSNDFVSAIMTDQAGQLWVGTQQGLNRLDTATGLTAHYVSDPNKPASLSNDEIHSLAADPNGGLWVGTASGLNFIDPSGETVTRFGASGTSPNDLASAFVIALFLDQEDNLWAGTTQGLYQVDLQTQAVTHYQNDPNLPDSLSNNFVISVYEDRAGRVWAGTREGGLNRLDRTKGTFSHYQNNPQDPTSLSNDTIGSIYEDRSGILWLGTWGGDLNLIDPYRRKFPAAFPVKLPTSILDTGSGALWVGTVGNGLHHIDRATGVDTAYVHEPNNPESLRDDQVFALAYDPQGNLWVGTASGLDWLAPDSKVFNHYPSGPDQPQGLSNPEVWSLYPDSKGMLWIGTDDGLDQLDPTTRNMRHYLHDPNDANSLSDDLVISIQADQTGQIWVGTGNGLNQLDPPTGKITRYVHNPNEPTSLTDGVINTIHIAKDNSLWLGTWGGGLDHFDPSQSVFTHYSKANGLSDDLVLGILEDKTGKLWLTTSQGLTLFDPQSKAARIYDASDGLPDPTFVQGAFWQNESGELFIGAGTGVVAFRPEDLHDNPNPPTVALTDFLLFNQSVPVGPASPVTQTANYLKAITLSHDQSVFSFEFAALNFTNSAKNQYAYKLAGFDQDWNYVGTRRLATYTNLNSGTYTFEVKAANNDGVWSNQNLSIEVTILPPWWQTWWAYGFYLLASVGVIAALIQLRTRAQAHELTHERKLRETLERVEEMKDEDRARMAREMHDGLAQTLAGLRFRSKTWATLLKNDASRLPNEFEDLGQILDESLEDVRRSIFDLRPLRLEEEGLFAAIEQLTTHLGQQYKLPVQVLLTGDEKTLPPDIAHATFRIVQEASHNVVKHAQAAHLWVKVAVEKNQVAVEVRDDGQGFDPAQTANLTRSEHYGLAHLHERVTSLKGRLTLESAPHQGTLLKISLPL